MKKITNFLLLFFFTGIISVVAQKNMVQFLTAGKEDAGKLINGYISPFLNTFGNNLNNGWYNSAQPLKLGRFCFTLGATASFVPSADRNFTINPSDYSTISTLNNQPVSTPTMFGANKSGGTVNVGYNTSAGSLSTPLDLPKGTGIGISPLPIAQLSIGLVKGTEVMGRFFPKLNISGKKIGFWGVGIKHSIKQWIPVINKAPFDLSFIGAYTNASIDLTNGPFLNPQSGIADSTNADFSNQAIGFKSNAWNANIIISKTFTVLTVYGGFRLSHSKTNLDFTGNYPITVYNNSGIKKIANLVDPISLEGKTTQFGINAGFRIKFAFMAICADGTWVPNGYSSATLGLAIGFFN
ncbi:MAG: hypothetical protein HGB12_02460 [Bacteroidetes bacterium]|nr:hypothetical protein [Bacteroidota bacterium]